MDQRTYNSLYRRGLRPKPENPYAFCESIADVTQVHKIELKKLQTFKKKISDSLNSDMSMAEKFFFKEQLPLLAGNLDMSTVIDIMCKDMDSYTWSPDIFNTLDSIGVDTANIRRRFQLEFGKKTKKSVEPELTQIQKKFFKRELTIIWSPVVDDICEDIDSYTSSSAIFKALDNVGVDSSDIRSQFESLFKKAKKSEAVSPPVFAPTFIPASPEHASQDPFDVVVVQHQTLDERLASDLANAEKNGTLIVIS